MDSRDFHDTDPEEAAALAVLDRLGRFEGPDETSVPEPSDQVEEVLRRLYGEVAGLLVYDLAPQRPDPSLRDRLLTAVVGDRTQEVPPLLAPPARRTGWSDAPHGPAENRQAQRPAGPVDSGFVESPLRRSHQVRSRRWPRWAAIAAAVAVVAAGGFWIAYLQSELRATESRLAWAEREWKQQVGTARGELAQLAQKYETVTSPSLTIYSLRCPTGHGPAAAARAFVYIPPDRSNWELAVHGLAPEPAGRDYQVWFLVGDRPRSGGCFHVENGRAELAMQQSAPPGVTAVAITVEPKGGSPRPTGDTILVAEQATRL